MSAQKNTESLCPETHFKLGPLSVDAGSRLLSHEGKTRLCEPRLFDLLCYLCSQQGKIVSREMLIKNVWRGRAVGDNTIDRKIYELRKLLAELDGDREYIKTQPKYGYRLVQPIRLPDRRDKLQRVLKSLHTPLVPALLILAAALAWLILHLGDGTLEANPPPHKIIHSKSFSTDATFSPNGHYLLYSRQYEDANYQLILKNLDTADEQPLTDGNSIDLGAQWHPDLSKIAFIRRQSKPEDSCAIYQLDPQHPTNQLQKLVNCSTDSTPTLAWGNNTDRLFFTDRKDHHSPYVLYSLDTKNRVKHQLTQPELHSKGDYYVTRNRTGTKLCLLRQKPDGKVSLATFISHSFIPLDSVDLDGKPSAVAWADEHIFYLEQQRSLYRLDSQDPQLKAIYRFNADIKGLSWSERSRQLLINSETLDSDIWRFVDGQSSSFIGSTRTERHPRFAHHSRRIAFVSDRSGSRQFWLKAQDGSVRQLSDVGFPLDETAFEWSPDDTRLLFKHNGRLYTLGIADSRLKMLLDQQAQIESPSWSSDGNSVYFSSDLTGRSQIWQLEVKTRHAKQLTKEGGYQAKEHPSDGKLYFTKPDMEGLWRWDGPNQVTQVLSDVPFENWMLRGDSVIYAKSGKGIYRETLDGTEKRQLFALSDSTLPAFSLSPDGKEILYSKIIAHTGEILALNFVD